MSAPCLEAACRQGAGCHPTGTPAISRTSRGGLLLKLIEEGYTQQGLRLPLPGNDDETAKREYTRGFVLDRDAETGKKFGLTCGEAYHYIGRAPAKVEDFVRKNAVKL